MTLQFDYYFSFRSPYSYLSTPMVAALTERYDMAPRMRVVLPIAVRIPGFFKTVNPLWPPYLMRDTYRISQMHGIPYGWPKPDPIVMDIGTGEVPADQPYIYRISRMGVAASRAGKGFDFIRHAAAKIWSGKVQDWHEGPHLADAAAAAGLDFAALERTVVAEAQSLDAEIAQNESDQKAAGHWGVPLFAFEGECFFGQDRLDHLVWRMKQHGLKEK